ncbi:lysine N(6)-hydroxylase/L-ornithine N(5)-oxygenase family protein [Actinoalloteichus hymeniacidonis]|uniref:L-lysine N6-monooxygenase MbtG n=1 Tax=Actinoalloteichus hymeniacidonis TaxID=340345 RepID=A0AAC9HQF1_9PSEU|nr:SidA/IucD/PvdA family monooxygenase [Actinoalloteichus hymeniacidonis]AOS63081.1 lysine/ornithine N-monooxygenase [Actinoalloteichus hymeniacidonis]MBB5908883.1 lysine N6-hydroxylase [Actinoalloteichus hymeniacidonis]
MSVERCDVLAVGGGPFNLGLAALAEPLADLDVVVCEAAAEAEWSWHSGVLFDDAILQVGFLADLVSLVDPTSPLSFLNYLRDRGRLYQFYVRERFHPTRLEYQDYLRWAASSLDVRYGHRVRTVTWDVEAQRFAVSISGPDGESREISARHLALGVGTAPWLPPELAGLGADAVVHSADYLHRVADLDRAERVTVVGSGQSGAEVMLDLLRRSGSRGPRLSWLTRTESFAPLDYSKLVLEMTTPDYVRYFAGLPEQVRDTLIANQWRHYKGISEETLDDLHDEFYRRQAHGGPEVELRSGVAVRGAAAHDRGLTLDCVHRDTGGRFEHHTDIVVAATGYRHRSTEFLAPIADRLGRDDAGRLQIREDHSVATDPSIVGRIFASNADLHRHGVAAPDLGFGAVRNAVVLNTVLDREAYRLPTRTAFTSFGTPGEGG